MKKQSIILIPVILAFVILMFVGCSASNEVDTNPDSHSEPPLVETSEPPDNSPEPSENSPELMSDAIPEYITIGGEKIRTAETHETSSNNKETEVHSTSTPIMPQTFDDITTLSENTVRFAGVEGEFKSIEYYSESRLSFGEHSVALTKGQTSAIEFSEDFLKIDDNIIQFENYYKPTAFFIVDLNVNDEYCEVLIWEYGTNDWIDNNLFRYDGNSVTEVARFIGWAFIDSYGKLIIANNVGGDFPGVISDPRITRSYYEYRKGILEEILVPIKGMSFKFAEKYASFGFYETPDAPTYEFVQELISGSYNFDSVDIGSGIYERNFAGKRFTILDHSEQESWFRGAWYYVQLEDGRKGIIHWWYAG